MSLPIRASHKLWETPEISEINRLPMHAARIPFADKYEALQYKLEASSLRIPLDGEWDFELFQQPEDVPADALQKESPGGDRRKITVPGNWTMQNTGDKPIYTNTQMPWENRPPLVPQQNPTGVYRTTFSIPQQWTANSNLGRQSPCRSRH